MIVLQVIAVVSLVWWSTQALLLIRAWFGVRRVDQLDSAPPAQWPKLSVVMPARNEGAHLEAALRAKLASSYPNLELVLVNDRSTDDTGAIAERLAATDARLRVVHLTELPDGWLGKLYAQQRGLEACSGEYVLFSDADIVIAPGTFERVMAECERRSLDFLTIFPKVHPRGFVLQLSLATMFRTLILFTRPWAVRDRSSSAFMGVGAFNLVRRSALAKTKGFEWLKMETGDDVALGQMMKRSGAACDVVLGGEAVSLEFYPSFTVMMRAVEKNGGSGPMPVIVVFVLFLVLLELGFVAGFAVGGAFFWAALAAVFATPIVSVLVSRFLHTPAATSPVAALGAIPFGFVMVRSSVLALIRGGVRWRDTFYPLPVVKAGRRVFGAPK